MQKTEKKSIDTQRTARRAGPNTQDLVTEQTWYIEEDQTMLTKKIDEKSTLEKLLIDLEKPENKKLAEKFVVQILDRLVHPPTMPEHMIEAILKGGGEYHYLPWWHYVWAKRLWFSISVSCMMTLLFGYVFNLWSMWLQPFIIATIGSASLYMQYQIFGPKIQKASKERNATLTKELSYLLLGSCILFILLIIMRMIL